MHVDINLVLLFFTILGGTLGYIVSITIQGSLSVKNEQRINHLEADQKEIKTWLKEVDHKTDTVLNNITEIKMILKQNFGEQTHV